METLSQSGDCKAEEGFSRAAPAEDVSLVDVHEAEHGEREDRLATAEFSLLPLTPRWSQDRSGLRGKHGASKIEANSYVGINPRRTGCRQRGDFVVI